MDSENKSTKERREFYRVTCKASIDFRFNDASSKSVDELFTLPPEYQLLNEYRSINHDAAVLLSQISENNKTLGNYLKSINRKLDILATAIVSKLSPIEEDLLQTIDISEGGMKCLLTKHIPEKQIIAVKLTLLPDNLIFTFKATTKYCSNKNSTRSGKTGYSANIEFIEMDTTEQNLLSKFVVQQQRRHLHHLK